MHISLDAALQRQPLLSTVGDKLLPSFPGAAAAYSLRALNGDANNVVNVRRDGDDGERDFTAEGVAFELEDWVNGKLETTLPADVATAAAAYSLRKVRNEYSGNAVQIRRASDDVEVNVAFDSNGEVSTSSAISNVVESPDQGDTTSTTLGEFLTEVVDILDEPNFATDTGTLLGFGSTLTFDNDSVSDGSVSKDDCLEVELTSASNAYVRDYGANLYSGINNVKIRFEADFYAPSTNTSAVNLRLQNTFEEINGGGSQVFFPTTKGAWTSVSVEGYPNQNALQILVLDRTVGDVYYFANMKISIIGHDGTVVTWYDQSGNGNHATQLTTGEQPLIAGGGSLITDENNFPAIEFSHTNSTFGYLEFNPFYSTGDDISAFVVTERETNGDWNILLGYDNNNSALSGAFAMSDFGATKQPRANAGFTTVNNSVVNDDVVNLRTVLWNDSTRLLSQYVDGADLTTATGTGSVVAPPDKNRIGDTYTIGVFGTTKISEIVLYNSDQSANRFKIESNINNYYGIYTAAEDGFVETWYDQSGNGRHAEQLTTDDQPRIVSNGSYLGELDFDGNDDALTFTGPATTAWSLACVCDIEGATGGAQGIFGTGGAANKFELIHATVVNQLLLRTLSSNDTSVSLAEPTGKILVWSNTSGDGTINLAVDGGALSSNTGHETDFSVTAFSIGKTDNDYLDGQIMEVVFYNSDQFANRTGIESNIADEYGITLS